MLFIFVSGGNFGNWKFRAAVNFHFQYTQYGVYIYVIIYITPRPPSEFIMEVVKWIE